MSTRAFVPLFALAILLAASSAPAQSPGIVARFPAPRQVMRDFRDDPSRRVALQVLYHALQEKTPPPRSRAASERITAYFLAFGNVDAPYLRQRPDSPARKRYFDRVRRLLSDPNFKRAVLNKYRLAALPAERPARVVRARQDPTDLIGQALPRALPYWIAALVAIALLPPLLELVLYRGPVAKASRAPAEDDLELPDSLRVCNVLGRRFALNLESGLVIRVETTNGADRLWMRNLSGYESTSRYASGIFPAREGHVVSLVDAGRRLPDGSPEILFGYNHATRQYGTVHRAYRCPRTPHITRAVAAHNGGGGGRSSCRDLGRRAAGGSGDPG